MKRGRKTGTKIGSKYEKSRDLSGKLDYNLEYEREIGKKRFPDISYEMRRERAIANGKPMPSLQCPFCGRLIYKKVAVDASGMPKRGNKDPFTDIVKVNGNMERRFAGVSAGELTPVCVRYHGGGLGIFLNPKESISPRMLNRIDHDLYLDFKKKLEMTLNNFRVD